MYSVTVPSLPRLQVAAGAVAGNSRDETQSGIILWHKKVTLYRTLNLNDRKGLSEGGIENVICKDSPALLRHRGSWGDEENFTNQGIHWTCSLESRATVAENKMKSRDATVAWRVRVRRYQEDLANTELAALLRARYKSNPFQHSDYLFAWDYDFQLLFEDEGTSRRIVSPGKL